MKKLCAFVMSAMFVFCGFNIINAEDSENNIVYKSENQILEKDINYVSEYTLLGSPNDNDGKKIRVVGVFEYDINNAALYASSESYDLGITKNALWCNVSPKKLKTNYDSLKELSGKYVMIEGVFNGLHSGHKDKYSGSIENVSKIQVWDKQK